MYLFRYFYTLIYFQTKTYSNAHKHNNKHPHTHTHTRTEPQTNTQIFMSSVVPITMDHNIFQNVQRYVLWHATILIRTNNLCPGSGT